MILEYSEIPEEKTVEVDIITELFQVSSKMQSEIQEMIDIRIAFNEWKKNLNMDFSPKIIEKLKTGFSVTALKQTPTQLIVRPESWEEYGLKILFQICNQKSAKGIKI